MTMFDIYIEFLIKYYNWSQKRIMNWVNLNILIHKQNFHKRYYTFCKELDTSTKYPIDMFRQSVPDMTSTVFLKIFYIGKRTRNMTSKEEWKHVNDFIKFYEMDLTNV